jgi:predicted dehydrogenase
LSNNIKYKYLEILLVGTGYMAKEYAKVLEGLKVSYEVIGRGEVNCNSFKEMFPQARVYAGGLESFKPNKKYTHGIISSNVDFLASHTKLVIGLGIKDILLEKPGGTNLQEIVDLAEFVRKHKAKVVIAYNRRFYSSVLKCRELINEDGGLKSFHFEFTEWPHTIEDLPNYETVKNNLLFANSTHIIDIAFYLGGMPKEIKSFSTDKLEWHPKAIFSGAGITKNNALFSYQANWKGPGRWVAEFVTDKHRYIFKPLEMLQIQELKSVKVEQIVIEDELDKLYKPGLYKQTEAFLFRPEDSSLIELDQQEQNCREIYQVILEGN